MKQFLLYLLLMPFFSISQTINEIDKDGEKQGIWSKNYKNKNVRYKGQFKDDKPKGLFFYYYDSGELKAEKEFFHDGAAATTHLFYKD